MATSSDATASVATSVEVASEETAVSDPPRDVAEDPSDPDILVLGFQELDLSTEALLYSTKTTREDAWCTAVFAGLGEKAVLYEKVRVSRRSWSNWCGGYTGVSGLAHSELFAPPSQLVSKQLVGMLLVLIVKKRLRPNFSDVRTTSVGAGIMGIMVRDPFSQCDSSVTASLFSDRATKGRQRYASCSHRPRPDPQITNLRPGLPP